MTVGLRLVLAAGCATAWLALPAGAHAMHGPGSRGATPQATPVIPRRFPVPPHTQRGCTVRPFSDGTGIVWVQTCFIG